MKVSEAAQYKILAGLILIVGLGSGCTITVASTNLEPSAVAIAAAPTPIALPTPTPDTIRAQRYLKKANRVLASVYAGLGQMDIDMRDLSQASAVDFDKEFWLVRAKGTKSVFGMPQTWLDDIKNQGGVPDDFKTFHKRLTALAKQSTECGRTFAGGLRICIKGLEPGAERALGRLAILKRDNLLTESEELRPVLTQACQQYGVEPPREPTFL